MNKCLNCGNELSNTAKKYCCGNCQQEVQRMEKVTAWLNGDNTGVRGKTATTRWIKWYLIKLHGEKCMECDWAESNQHTHNVPIELEHIDGDFTNNNIKNLKLLCPNCHSLTSTYKGANKKQGRPRSKYYRGF